MKTGGTLLLLAVLLCDWSRAEVSSTNDLLLVPAVTPRGAGDVSEAEPRAAVAEGIAAAASVEGEIYPLSRYSGLWTRSPFQLESIAPTPQSEGIGQRFALTGIAQIDGEPIVFVMERATQQRTMVKKNGNKSGLSLVQVDVQQKYADSTATVRLDGEVGVVKFDAAAVPATPQMGMPTAPRAVQPGMPQVMVAPQVVPPGAVQPSAPMVPPGQSVPGAPNPGAVQNGQIQPNPNPGQQGQTPQPRVIRRRAIIPAAP